MSLPVVDVVLPVRNGGRLLRRAVDSVLAQQGVQVQLYLVDDGSSDRAVQRLPADPRITVLRTEGVGIVRALRLGCSAGDADFVARQDADDVSLAGRLADQVAHLQAHPEVCLAGTTFEVVVGRRVVATLSPEPDGLLDQNPLCHGSVMMRRSVLQDTGGYREVFAGAEDYDLWLRCAEHGELAVLPRPGYRYRLTAGMSTISRGPTQTAFAQLARQSALARRAGTPDPAEDALAVAEFIQRELQGGDGQADPEVDAWWAVELAALGDRREGLRCLRRAAPSLTVRRRLHLLRQVLVPPAPQARWS